MKKKPLSMMLYPEKAEHKIEIFNFCSNIKFLHSFDRKVPYHDGLHCTVHVSHDSLNINTGN